MSAVWITTTNNPFDYFTDIRDWYFFDQTQHGYKTCSLVASFAHTYFEMSDEDFNREIESAIDEIIANPIYNPVDEEEVDGKKVTVYYKKVYESTPKGPSEG